MMHNRRTPCICLLFFALLYLSNETYGFQPIVPTTGTKLRNLHSKSPSNASTNKHHSIPSIHPRNSARTANSPTNVQLFYQDDDNNPDGRRGRGSSSSFESQREFELKVNSFLRASHASFQHVETSTNQLLNRHPMIALAIFVGTGALVAYLTGLFFLGGYIETWNPVDNDSIPYWDDEILIVSRKMGR